MKKVSVLFICMGNICRSPTAHGVLQKVVEEQGLDEAILIDSAGTHAYHVGEPPDRRSQVVAKARGYDLSQLRARQVNRQDFHEHDYLLAMDRANLEILEQNCPEELRHKLRLFLEFAPQYDVDEVPDPYYGGAQGFEYVLDLVEAASTGLVEDIRKRYL